jgi:hypothetical protein
VFDEDASVDEVAQGSIRRLQGHAELGRNDGSGQHEMSREQIESAPGCCVSAEASSAMARCGQPRPPLTLQAPDGGDELLLRTPGTGHSLGEPMNPRVVVTHAEQDQSRAVAADIGRDARAHGVIATAPVLSSAEVARYHAPWRAEPHNFADELPSLRAAEDQAGPALRPRPILGLVHRIFTTSVASVYPHYLAKVERKGRTQAELDEVIEWLTGFDEATLQQRLDAGTTFEEFFAEAQLNPKAASITGVVCGVRVQDIDDPLMQKIRYLDKLVDELAKGKPMEKVLRS